MLTRSSKNDTRQRVHQRIRKKMMGTPERPRLNVYRSLNHIYVQLVDDTTGQTLAAAGTTAKGLQGELGEDDKTAAAKRVGAAIAKAAMDKGIKYAEEKIRRKEGKTGAA